MKLASHTYSALILTGLSLLTFLVFVPSFQAGFLNWDDGFYVLKNPLIRSLSPLQAFDPNTFVMGNYHPITLITYQVDYWVGGLNPRIFHLHNLLIHVLNGLLVWFLGRSFNQNTLICLIATALFLIHPSRVEVVMWVSDRKDLLMSFWGLLSLLAYKKYYRLNTLSWWTLSLACFVMACLSKATAVGLVIFAVLAISLFSTQKIKDFISIVPMFLISIAVGLIAIKAQSSHNLIAFNSIKSGLNFLNPLEAIHLYIRNFYGPFHLSPITSATGSGFAIGIGALWASFMILGVVNIKHKTPLLGLVFFMTFLLPVLQLKQVGEAVAADRYVYLPYIGLFYFVAFYGKKTIQRLPHFKWLFVIALLLLSVQTFQYAQHWTHSISLWTYQIQKFPAHSTAYVNRGVAYHEQGEPKLALADFSEAIAINHHPLAYVHKAKIAVQHNQLNLAEHILLDGTIPNPEFPAIRNNLGLVFKQQQKYEQAINQFEFAFSLDSTYRESMLNKANTLMAMEQFNKAEQIFKQELELSKYNVNIINGLASCYAYQEKHQKALEMFNYGLEHYPSNRTLLENKNRLLK